MAVSEIDRTFVQDFTFDATDSQEYIQNDGITGVSVIRSTTSADTTGYNIVNQTVWLIKPEDEGAGGGSTSKEYNDFQQISDPFWDEYKILRINDKGNHIFEITALQHNKNKYDLVSEKLYFEQPSSQFETPPLATTQLFATQTR